MENAKKMKILKDLRIAFNRSYKRRFYLYVIAFLVIIIISLGFSLLIVEWEPFSAESGTSLWQMFLNVITGAGITAVIVAIVSVIQSNSQNKLQHHQAITRDKKTKLFDKVLKYAVDAAYKTEATSDIQIIEKYLYQLRLYSKDNVFNAATDMFKSVTQSDCGQEKAKILEFCAACNEELYEEGCGSYRECEKEFLIIQSNILRLSITEFAKQILHPVVFNYRSHQGNLINDSAWYHITNADCIEQYNDVVDMHFGNANVRAKSEETATNQKNTTKIPDYHIQTPTHPKLFLFLTYISGRLPSFGVVGLARVTPDGAISWEGTLSLQNPISLKKIIPFDSLMLTSVEKNDRHLVEEIKELSDDKAVVLYYRARDYISEARKRVFIKLPMRFNISGKATLLPSHNLIQINTIYTFQLLDMFSYIYQNNKNLFIKFQLNADDKDPLIYSPDSSIPMSIPKINQLRILQNSSLKDPALNEFYSFLRDHLKTKLDIESSPTTYKAWLDIVWEGKPICEITEATLTFTYDGITPDNESAMLGDWEEESTDV